MRIMILEFKDCDSVIFDEIMEVVNCHPDIEYLRVKDEENDWNYAFTIKGILPAEVLKNRE